MLVFEKTTMYRLLNVYHKIFGLSSYGEASPPYERVPNILRNTFIKPFYYIPLNSHFILSNTFT